MSRDVQVIIVGGGYSGMNCALILGRCLVKTVIINEEKPRNAVVKAAYGFLTRDGTHPLEFLRLGKEELKKYHEYVTYVKGVVTDASKTASGGFKVDVEGQGSFTAKRIVWATGMKDDMDKVGLKGIHEIWGKSMFHCPFCDGFEFRGKTMALFGYEEYVDHFAKGIRNWASDLVLFTKPGIISAETKVEFAKNKIRVIEDDVEELQSKDGQLTAVKMVNGEIIPREIGFLFATGESVSELPKKHGATLGEMGSYDAETDGKTKVPGLYIVGDLKDYLTGAIGAASQGAAIAEAIAHDLFDENWIK